jgi:hypothetical protein
VVDHKQNKKSDSLKGMEKNSDLSQKYIVDLLSFIYDSNIKQKSNLFGQYKHKKETVV